jgi:dienelactone hydrolase
MQIDRREALQTVAGALIGTLQRPETFLESGRCVSTSQSGFDDFCFSDQAGRRHQVYVADGGGPPVILLHELPGLVDEDLTTARELAGLGYTVIAPLLFGEAGGSGHSIKYAVSLCGHDQFACNEGEVTSPHVLWLRQLVSEVWTRWPLGRGIGVIGMCLTGAFPLALLSDPHVKAAVLCQPTLPINAFSRFGLFTDKKALGLSPHDLDRAKERDDVPILGLRYTGDWRSRSQRFQRLATEFSTRFYRMDIVGKHHSTIALDYCGLAFDEVKAFFNQYLRSEPDTSIRFPFKSVRNSPKEVTIQGCEMPRPQH